MESLCSPHAQVWGPYSLAGRGSGKCSARENSQICNVLPSGVTVGSRRIPLSSTLPVRYSEWLWRSDSLMERHKKQCNSRLKAVANTEQVKSEEELEEEDILVGLNETANEALRVMLGGKDSEVVALMEKMEYIREFLEQEKQTDAERFVRIVLAMLDHKILLEADDLRGVHKKAFDRMCHLLEDSGWKLKVPGEGEEEGEDMVDEEEMMPPVFI
eukprot:TRINITY_DN1547_c0_g1_i1.p1 TRINITY_DN1547_c0_g1~~TRINITY_DN1547_c0_g1_i1.p1  ORF type:complete len:226 (+),score=52.25 TRINITY_DN1547_c0_g1_i1:34-678(+)